MAEENIQTNAPEQDLSEILKVRREKLAQLQAEGMDPFTITRFVSTTTAQEIKDHFDEMEGKPVSIAGRLMSKRGMGKVSFCDLQDKTGRIQLYARKDEMDEAAYNRFKKYDIGDIVGVEGEIFRTQRGEMSVRAKTITLLSGGEKAFVAIALYFAILKVHPTPFCVMDEIEAALDEANVVRYARYMRRIAGKTQFIVITHRRGTMEEADVLYGVTMQEKGVSRILTINLNDMAKELKIK